MFHAFAVVAEPGPAAAELLRRYGDLMTRMTLYTPYPIAPAVVRQITADLQADMAMADYRGHRDPDYRNR